MIFFGYFFFVSLLMIILIHFFISGKMLHFSYIDIQVAFGGISWYIVSLFINSWLVWLQTLQLFWKSFLITRQSTVYPVIQKQDSTPPFKL